MRRLSPGLLVGLAVAASALATAASAADLPVPAAPAYTPPVYRPVIYDWTGIYGGVNVGAGALDDVVTNTTTTALLNAGTQTKLSPFSLVGGAQAGFNIEFAPFVFGAEGTFTWSNISGTHVTPSLLPTISENSVSTPQWYATATGKAGFAANDFLFYAKGGAAWMGVHYSQNIAAGGVQSAQTIIDTRSGFTVGGGVEWGLTESLSARLEYDFLDFGTKTYNFNNLSFTPAGSAVGTPPTPVGAAPMSIKSVTQLITVGLNYRFNWGGGGPVVTR
ncbi:MAG TPA: outer membrane beta-barrel protein [Xanthobacteraceae bacterium]|nr:outer membrane beta-barrel protein [Xanthobacteraceae bacterium]